MLSGWSDEGLRGLSRGDGAGGVVCGGVMVPVDWKTVSRAGIVKRRLKLGEGVDLGALEPLRMEVRTLLTLLAGSVICFRPRLHGANGANGGENEWFLDANLEDSQATVEFTIAKLRYGHDDLSKLRPSPVSVDCPVVGWGVWGSGGAAEACGGLTWWLAERVVSAKREVGAGVE